MPTFISLGKSKQFYNFLRAALINGEYKVGAKFPSLKELSEKYEISKPTVNSVISNLANEGFLRIEQGKGTFVVRTNIGQTKGENLVGVIMEEYSHDINIENVILGSISENLKKDGFYVIPINTYDDSGRFIEALKSLVKLEVSGLIVLPPPSENYDVKEAINIVGKLPVICINRDIEFPNHDLVIVDFEQGGRIAAEYLISQGRKRILLPVCHGPTLYSLLAKGYRRAYEDRGLPIDESLIHVDEADMPERLKNADGLIATDREIYNNIQLFEKSGIRLPADMGVVGINDSSFSRICTPPLTSLRFSGEQIGYQSANLLLARLRHPEQEVMHVNIPMSLVYRKT